MKGDLPIQIKWVLNSSPIPTNNNIGITIVKLSAKTSVLNIASLDAHHRGVFKCIAENGAGVVEYASELHVNGSYKISLQIFNFFFLLSVTSTLLHSST